MKIKELIEGFGKLFDEQVYLGLEDVIPESERLGYFTRDNICMIVPYKKHILNNLENNFEVEGGKVLPLEFKSSINDEIKAKYSTEYLQIVLKMTKKYDELTFYMANDYPLKVECEDFAFILAPRIIDE